MTGISGLRGANRPARRARVTLGVGRVVAQDRGERLDDVAADSWHPRAVAADQATLSGYPARILRAAQFHEFVAQLVEWGRQDGVSYVPPATESSGATILEIAGPREESLVDMARLLSPGAVIRCGSRA